MADDSAEQVLREVRITHAQGMHTRPVMKFVDLAQKFVSEVRVSSLRNTAEIVNGKSAMELMLLGATCGTTLRIQAIGSDAPQAVDALVALVVNRFDIDS